MKNSKIVTVIAAALLMVGLVPLGSAQENNIPEGIEVITIVAKRQDPTLAMACVDEARAKTSASVGDGQPTRMDRMNFRRAMTSCMERVGAHSEVRI